ncbi:hypothetical protein EHQ05_13775 [Leptospira yasudae]|uniref:hypothetical protein n=1 Tax=Leptospira yasudae TaxID=2202201 RepID=UPI001084723B|nr:hypothetical protein [Leptospira yasudae]TGK24014.1 hypothetical protein EHQ05_13775 [Leptospira yasudae]TGM00623.1 hypothetical protein EHQ86_18675 [Leptospira yasudae]
MTNKQFIIIVFLILTVSSLVGNEVIDISKDSISIKETINEYLKEELENCDSCVPQDSEERKKIKSLLAKSYSAYIGTDQQFKIYIVDDFKLLGPLECFKAPIFNHPRGYEEEKIIGYRNVCSYPIDLIISHTVGLNKIEKFKKLEKREILVLKEFGKIKILSSLQGFYMSKNGFAKYLKNDPIAKRKKNWVEYVF